MKRKPVLVIIPGIGDDTMIYQTFARRWHRFGYEVRVVSFGWAQRSARLRPKMEAFLTRIDKLQADELYIIGISAGGTAAVNTLARRPNVRKIITVSSPFTTMPHLQNPLLAESIEQARQHLLDFSSSQKVRILSVHALHDSVVSTELSRPAGVRTMRVPVFFHPIAIFVAMILYAPKLNAFFRKAT